MKYRRLLITSSIICTLMLTSCFLKFKRNSSSSNSSSSSSESPKIESQFTGTIRTSANLYCSVFDGIGTTTNNATKEVSLDNNKLTDGSFDHINGNIHTPNNSGTALADPPKGTIPLENATTELLYRGTTSGGDTIYTAATFKISFSISFNTQSGDYGLYLNRSSSDHSKITVVDDTTPRMAKAFRIAFYPDAVSSVFVGSSTHKTVFAGLQTKDNCRYVSGSESLVGTEYEADGAKDIIDSDYINQALPTSETPREEALDRPDLLAVFGFVPETRVTLIYTVVCWFEGTDPNTINNSSFSGFQSIAANLFFSTVKLN